MPLTSDALLDRNGLVIQIGGVGAVTLTGPPAPESVTINQGQTAVAWLSEGSDIVGGDDEASFQIYGSGLLVTEGSPLAPGVYAVDVLDEDTDALTSIALTVKSRLRGGPMFAPGEVPSIPCIPIRSKYAFDVSADLALADNTVSITPASYATWTAFLDANDPLTDKVILIGAGDYRSWGVCEITDIAQPHRGNGTTSRRVVFKYNGPNASWPPWERSSADQAQLLRFYSHDHSYYLLHGLTFDESALTPAAGQEMCVMMDSTNPDTLPSDGCVVDECWLPDTVGFGINFRGGQHISAQFNRVRRQRLKGYDHADVHGITAQGLQGSTRYLTDVRTVGNQIVNFSNQMTYADDGAFLDEFHLEKCYYGITCDNDVFAEDSYYMLGTPIQCHIEVGLTMRMGSRDPLKRGLLRGNFIHNLNEVVGSPGHAPDDTGGGAFIMHDTAGFYDVIDNLVVDCNCGVQEKAWSLWENPPYNAPPGSNEPSFGLSAEALAIVGPYTQFRNRHNYYARNVFDGIQLPVVEIAPAGGFDGTVFHTDSATVMEENTVSNSYKLSKTPGASPWIEPIPEYTNVWTNNSYSNVTDATER